MPSSFAHLLTLGRFLLAVVCVSLGAATSWAAPGDLDPTFGTGGKVTTAVSSLGDDAYAIVFQPDGKLVAAGGAYSPTTYASNFALARYDATGVTRNDTGRFSAKGE